MRIACLNKRFLPLNKAKIPILDSGFLYGEGVFETMRSYGGIPFLLERHITRLFGSLKTLRIRPNVSKAEIRKIVCELLKRNKLKDAYIKIIVTPGTVAVYVLPYKPLAKEAYEKGVKLFISKTILNEKSPIAGHKTLNYLPNLLCRRGAERKGFYDAALLNTGGFISEASNSNIFLVKEKKLYTPPLKSGILPGITRDEVIRIAVKEKCPVRETLITPEALYKADEAFLTSSLIEILPVVKVGNTPIGKGKPGPVTGKLTQLFGKHVQKGK